MSHWGVQQKLAEARAAGEGSAGELQSLRGQHSKDMTTHKQAAQKLQRQLAEAQAAAAGSATDANARQEQQAAEISGHKQANRELRERLADFEQVSS